VGGEKMSEIIKRIDIQKGDIPIIRAGTYNMMIILVGIGIIMLTRPAIPLFAFIFVLVIIVYSLLAYFFAVCRIEVYKEYLVFVLPLFKMTLVIDKVRKFSPSVSHGMLLMVFRRTDKLPLIVNVLTNDIAYAQKILSEVENTLLPK
jgi:hypothetical protein